MIAMLEEDWGVYGSYDPPVSTEERTDKKKKEQPTSTETPPKKKKPLWQKLWFKI